MKKKRTTKSKTLKSAAVLTVFGAPEYSPRGRKAVAKWLRARANDIEKHADVRWTNTTPTSANIGQVFWTRRIDDGEVRIAEVQEYRGKLELSFTQAETASHLDAFEYFGPLEPPD